MGSSSNVNGTSSPREKYPYPTDFNVLEFVPKLSSEGNYKNWKDSMRDFITRRGLIGFIKEEAVEESNRDDYMAWKRSDNLVQGWMLATLGEETRLRVLRLLTFKTAKELWKELRRILDATRSVLPEYGKKHKEGPRYLDLQKAAINGDREKAMAIIENDPDAIRSPIIFFLETALHLAITSKTSSSPRGNRFVRELLEKMTPQDVKDLVDHRGCTALHYAAEVGNTKGAKLLVQKNSDLPNVVAVGESGDTVPRRHYAAAEVGNKGGAKKLVRRNADLPNALVRKSGDTPDLHYAAEVDNKGGAKKLASRNNSDDLPNVVVGKSGDKPDPRYAAEVDQDDEEAKKLDSKKLDLGNVLEGKPGDTPLHCAARYGYEEMVRYLISVTRVEDILADDYKGASLLLLLTQCELYDIALT